MVPIEGSRPSLEQMRKAADLLADPALRPVFFHCVAGHHRTSLALAAYRIRHEGWSADRGLGRSLFASLGSSQDRQVRQEPDRSLRGEVRKPIRDSLTTGGKTGIARKACMPRGCSDCSCSARFVSWSSRKNHSSVGRPLRFSRTGPGNPGGGGSSRDRGSAAATIFWGSSPQCLAQSSAVFDHRSQALGMKRKRS